MALVVLFVASTAANAQIITATASAMNFAPPPNIMMVMKADGTVSVPPMHTIVDIKVELGLIANGAFSSYNPPKIATLVPPAQVNGTSTYSYTFQAIGLPVGTHSIKVTSTVTKMTIIGVFTVNVAPAFSSVVVR